MSTTSGQRSDVKYPCISRETNKMSWAKAVFDNRPVHERIDNTLVRLLARSWLHAVRSSGLGDLALGRRESEGDYVP